MPAYRPRSIVSLILVGFAVVLTPFIVAVVTAVIQVDRFAVENRAAVRNVGSATEDVRRLVEQSTEMQRALGQYAVLGEHEFFDIYVNRRSAFRSALDHLIELGLTGFDMDRLRSIADEEAGVFARVSGTNALPSSNAIGEALESLAGIARQARSVLAESDGLVEAYANDATANAESLQRLLLAMAAAAAPATVVLVIVFTVLITRPMSALGSAIRRLGARSLDEPVVVEGPRDIAALGSQLDWLRRRIRDLEQQKATFLQHISHELKTPLTTIREGSELLTESLEGGNPEDAEIARLLQQNGLHLHMLIEDLLRFARTRDLALDLEFAEDVDLGELISETVAAMAVIIDAKALEVRTRLAPVSARCDRSKIRTVVDNLLTNAVKYTPEHGRIDVDLGHSAANAVIDVRDSGPGVDERDRERIFEPFVQGSAEYESSVKGTGLGLSIAREYVEAHGGTIELVDSDKGAHFRVVLPLAGPENTEEGR